MRTAGSGSGFWSLLPVVIAERGGGGGFFGQWYKLGLAGKESVDGGGELVAAVEELKLEEEDEAHQFAAHLLDELSTSVGRATYRNQYLFLYMCVEYQCSSHTSSDNVVNDKDLLARLDGVSLHLEEVLAVLLLVANGLARTGKLALLAHGNEAGTETQGQAGTHQEATSLKADNDIGLLATVVGENVQLQGANEGLMQSVIGEDGHNILEQNSRRGEVRELAQGTAQLYLKTGEFGGAGGIVISGLSGLFGNWGGIWKGGGHDEREGGREEGKWVEEVEN
jgi:hypothetical protein